VGIRPKHIQPLRLALTEDRTELTETETEVIETENFGHKFGL
jgi:hypothetical protein